MGKGGISYWLPQIPTLTAWEFLTNKVDMMVVGIAWGLVKIFKDNILDVHIALFKMDNQQGLNVKKFFLHKKTKR